jgi:hypothetical protein
MATDQNAQSRRTELEKERERIMSHEKQRKHRQLHRLHMALAEAEADIIARKGPDWKNNQPANGGNQ